MADHSPKVSNGMFPWALHGHGNLTKALGAGQLAHAYLLVGLPQVGKTTMAMQLAQAVNCLENDPPCGHCQQCQRIQRHLHPDVQVVAPARDERTGRQRTEISIDQVRSLEHAAALGPYEGKSLVFIVDGAERLSQEAANALLKTLEEPPARVLMLLVTSEEERLLPTIRSRCHRLEVRPLSEDTIADVLTREHSVSPEDARLLARLSGGRLGWALSAATDPKVLEERQRRADNLLEVMAGGLERRFQFSQELAQQFGRDRATALGVLEFWLLWWRDVLMLKEQTPDLVFNVDWRQTLEETASRFTEAQIAPIIHKLRETMERLEQNANARMALDVFMLSLPSSGVTTA